MAQVAHIGHAHHMSKVLSHQLTPVAARLNSVSLLSTANVARAAGTGKITGNFVNDCASSKIFAFFMPESLLYMYSKFHLDDMHGS